MVGTNAGTGGLTSERRELAARYVGLVRVHLRTRLRLRRQTRSSRREYDEFFQTGCLALVQAAGRYDAGRDGSFAAYVLPRIRRAVHAAVLSERTLLPVPYGTASKRRRPTGLSSQPTPNVPAVSAAFSIGPDSEVGGLLVHSRVPRAHDCETIRHALRRRFERAAAQAVEDVAQRLRRDGAAAKLARIAAERLLVSAPEQRTPVRHLASELGLSSGQVTEYEQRLLAATGERLRADPTARLLIRFAGSDPEGLDGPVDEERRQWVVKTQLRQFERGFATAGTAERARILYTLIEQSAGGVNEVARNLFLLTLPHP